MSKHRPGKHKPGFNGGPVGALIFLIVAVIILWIVFDGLGII